MALKEKRIFKPTAKHLVALIAVIVAASVILSAILINTDGKGRRHDIFNTSKQVLSGIDVSEHNGKIDWKKVSRNIEFAFIRVGCRGYKTGKLMEDKYARENLRGASKAGIAAGVYFYSQAISEKEAEEEADFVLDFIDSYDVDLPVVIDFEYPADADGYETGRLAGAGLTMQQNTDIINAFCSEIANKGYTPALYASTYMLEYHIDTQKLLPDTVIWLADYNEKPTYSGDYDIWQYSKTGACDGVKSKYVDRNYWYMKD